MQTCDHEHMKQPHWLPVLEQKPAYNVSCRIQQEEHTTKTVKASLVPKLSAPSAHLISALLLLSLPVVNRSGWWGRCWFPPRRFLSLVNVTGALGAQIILEKPYFLVSFRSRAQAPKEWRRGGEEGDVRYHIHARRNDLTYLLGISVTFPLDR